MTLDPVTTFLSEQGFAPKHAYYEHTNLLMGQKIENEQWQLIYSFEDEGTLIIRGFQLQKESAGLSSATRALLRILRLLWYTTPAVKKIRAMLLPGTTPQMQRQQEKLATVLIKAGASFEEDLFGQLWLVKARQAEVAS